MHQLTVRGFDEALERKLRDLAAREGISLSQAALRFLRRGAGLPSPGQRRDVIGCDLDRFFGTWTDDEARALLDSIETCERIDEDAWQ